MVEIYTFFTFLLNSISRIILLLKFEKQGSDYSTIEYWIIGGFGIIVGGRLEAFPKINDKGAWNNGEGV